MIGIWRKGALVAISLLICYLFVSVSSVSIAQVKEHKGPLFVQSEYQTPQDEQGRRRYMGALNEHQTSLLNDFLKMGDHLHHLNPNDKKKMEGFKDDFLELARNIKDTGWMIVGKNEFSQKELFNYQSLIAKSDILYKQAMTLLEKYEITEEQVVNEVM